MSTHAADARRPGGAAGPAGPGGGESLAAEIALVRALIRRLIAEEDGPEAPLTAVQRTALVLKALETLARLLRAQAALTAQPARQDVTAALAEALRQLGQTPPPAGQDGAAAAKAPAPPALPGPAGDGHA